MSTRLSGKVCVITGTGGSIGRQAALAFAREGASVVGCDVNSDTAAATVEMVRRQDGAMVSLHPCHLSEPADCQALVRFALNSCEESSYVTGVDIVIDGGMKVW